MKPLEYKLVAMFADSALDLRTIIEDLLNSDIDNSTYDFIIELDNKLLEAESKLRRCYNLNSLFVYKKKVG